MGSLNASEGRDHLSDLLKAGVDVEVCAPGRDLREAIQAGVIVKIGDPEELQHKPAEGIDVGSLIREVTVDQLGGEEAEQRLCLQKLETKR